MHFLKRLLGALCVLLCAALFVACIGGVVAIRNVRQPLTERTTKAISRVDEVLGITNKGLKDLDAALERAEENLRQIKEVPVKSSSNLESDLMYKYLALKLQSDVGPKIGNVRETLLGISEATVVLNSLLVDVNELPLLQTSSLDAQKLKNVSGRLSEIGGLSNKMSGLLFEGNSAEGEASASRMQEDIESVRTTIAEFKSRLTEVQDRVTTLKSRATVWIDYGAVGLSVLLLWIAVSQVSLLIHAWSWFRKG